jgi:peptide/nickel transport system permease protein
VLVLGGLLAIGVLVVLFPAIVTRWGPEEATGARLASPSWSHLLGTDSLQRDLLARVLRAGRVSLVVGLGVAVLAGAIGVLVGMVAGMRGGWADEGLMRLTDLFLAAPALVVLLLLSRLPAHEAWARTLLGSIGSVRLVVTLLSLALWMPMARLVRGVVVGLRERDLTLAVRSLGAGRWHLVRHHLLPAARAPIVVQASLTVASAILIESAMSFLGFGVQEVTTPTWGNLLQGQSGALGYAPHLVWGPSLAIVLTVLLANAIGDALRR